MLSRYPWRCSALVLLFSFLPQANGQFFLVKNSPFEAIKTTTSFDPSDRFSCSGRVARNSDGSIYEETPDHVTGEILFIKILDVRRHRTLFLDVKRKTYQTSYYEPKPGARPTDQETENYIEFLKNIKPEKTIANGVEINSSSLGFRTQDGFLEYGRRTVRDHLEPTSHLRYKVWEDWTVPGLNVTVENTGLDENNQPGLIVKLNHLRASEPDPQIFEIPSGYTLYTPLPPKRPR